MARTAHAPPGDARLESLLELERRLQERVLVARREAADLVAKEREKARRLDADAHAAREVEAQREHEQDLAAHAKELRRITDDTQAQVDRLVSVPEAVVERLARETYRRVIAGGHSS
jgi:hypothetical protein